jgi:hypothetical protein
MCCHWGHYGNAPETQEEAGKRQGMAEMCVRATYGCVGTMAKEKGGSLAR